MEVLTIIQASSFSTRLPKKIGMKIAGKPILQHVWEAAPEPKVVTIPDRDEYSWKLCEQLGISWVPGPYKDLVASYLSANERRSRWILRLTADCPMLTLDYVKSFLSWPDYAWGTIYTNRPWDPDGYDLELFPIEALELAHKYATDPHDREHLTPWMYRHFNVRRCSIFLRPPQPENPDEKVSIDAEEDFMKVKDLMEHGL